MKPLLLSAVLALGATSATADGPVSALLAEVGPTRALTALATQVDPTPTDHMALGGLQFLAAIEQALQTRYTYGLGSEEMSMLLDLPFLRLPVAANPAPKDIPESIVEDIFQTALGQLAAANTHLDQIGDSDQVSLRLTLDDIWFDINRNSRTDPGEDLATLLAETWGGSSDEAQPGIVVQFDAADAAWLSAYAHMIQGMGELILATDPSEAIAEVIVGGKALDQLRGRPLDGTWLMQDDQLPTIDLAATVFRAIEGPLDATRTRAAHQHFLDGLADNRTFWSRVRTETDNTDEWIPSDAQVSALPLTFPQGIGASWEDVLSDAEAVLNGDYLLPHWRLGENAGFDLAQFLQNPPEIDIIGLFQGYTLVPYARRGDLIPFESLEAFDRQTGGNSPMFAILLN